VRSAEFVTIRAARRDGGTKARGDPPEAGRPRGEGTANKADGGRRPGIGIRGTGTRLRSGKLELRLAGQGTGTLGTPVPSPPRHVS